MHSHNHSDNDKGQLFGIAALAAGIGAITAVLFTKQSGSETRQALRDKFQEAKVKPQTIKRDINEAADNAKDIAQKVKAKAEDKAVETVDKATDKVNQIRKN